MATKAADIASFMMRSCYFRFNVAIAQERGEELLLAEYLDRVLPEDVELRVKFPQSAPEFQKEEFRHEVAWEMLNVPLQ